MILQIRSGGQTVALLSFSLAALIAATVHGSSGCYTVAVEQGICKPCSWATRIEDCGDDKCWPEADVPVCNGQDPPPRSGCYTVAVERGICQHCNWDTRIEDCGDDKCWPQPDVPVCNGQDPPPRSGCYTIAVEHGVCQHCDWDTRIEDCGDEKCWPETDVPICNGEPVETGFCNNKEFGGCVECTAGNVQSTCGADAACWSELDGCGDRADILPGGFCHDTGGLNIDGECRKCSVETQCPGPTRTNGYKCMSNVPGCYKENPEGNWIPPNPPDSPHIWYKCLTPGHVALTFDDGPNRTASLAVMDKLRELGDTKATFFINGKWISGVTGPLLVEMESRGHTVASHTVNHASLLGKAEDAGFIDIEIERNEVLAGGYLTRGLKRYMRPPYLEIDAAMANKLGSMGYKVVQINVDTDDFREGMQSQHVMRHFDGVFEHADPSIHSYIILQHDAYAQGHLEAIEHVVTTARNKGFTFVDMETCLGPVGAGPVGTTPLPSNVCANEVWGKCTPCEATRCEGSGTDKKRYDDLNIVNPGCECWSEYPGCSEGDLPTGYCDTDDGTCQKCTWSNHCGAGAHEDSCLDIKLGCSTLAEAHRWKPASGTIYNSWPEPGTVECADASEGGYNGCKWAGMFTYIQNEGSADCKLPAVFLPRPDRDADYQCRIPKEDVRNWKVASTWEEQPQLQNRKLRIMVSGGEHTTEVNVIDTCSDNDCEGCCSMNSANGEYPLLDLEVGPTLDLLPDVRRHLRGLAGDPSVSDLDERFPQNERPVTGDPNLIPEVMAGLPFAAGGGVKEGFSMIVSSDPQYRWYDEVYPANLSWDDKPAIAANAQRQIRQQYESMVRLANERKDSNGLQVKGVLINGDLTNFGAQNGDFQYFQNLVRTLESSDLFKVYPALGNHDYGKNNVNECFNNVCASTMVKYLVNWLKAPEQSSVNKAPFPMEIGSQTFYGSLAYSFNEGKVHFVQLQNYPSYTNEWANPGQVGGYYFYKIAKSMDWLEHDLALARNRGDIIIVSLHDYGDQFKGHEQTLFNQFMEKYRVSAVFAGHIHKDCGKVTWVGSTRVPFPFFRSGSASYQDYLVADINLSLKEMDVWKHEDTTLDGEYTKKSSWSVALIDDKPEPPLPVPPMNKEGFVSFFNQGGYNAEFRLSYIHDGKTTEITTVENVNGGKYYMIPEGATDIRMLAKAHGGVNIFDESFDKPPIKCYKTYGTTLSPAFDCNYCGFDAAEPCCWPDGTVCGAGTTCNMCCNRAFNELGTKCGGSCWPDGTVCGAGTTCDLCCNKAFNELGTQCGGSCWPDGTICGAGTTCDLCCNPANDALGTQCGGSCWPDGTVCGAGTTCNNCCNRAFNAGGTQCGGSWWEDGTVCGLGTTCNLCCNGSNWWWSKFITACGKEW